MELRAAAGATWVQGRRALPGTVEAVHRLLTRPGAGHPLIVRQAVGRARTDDELRAAVHQAAAWAVSIGELEHAAAILRAAEPICTPPRCVLWALRLWIRARRRSC